MLLDERKTKDDTVRLTVLLRLVLLLRLDLLHSVGNATLVLLKTHWLPLCLTVG
jgi:hypothetical protein